MKEIKSLFINRPVLCSRLMALAPFGFFGQIDVDAVNPNPDSGVTVESTVQDVVNILLFVVGAAAVIMLVIGAIRYVVSAGDQQAVAGAKNTIIYAIVGIVVAVMAFAIVNFVFDEVSTNVEGSG